MAQQKRPYAVKQRPELEALAKLNWNSKSVLESISHELKFRQKKASIELRNKILQRLKTLAEQELAHYEENLEVEAEKTLLEYMGYSAAGNLNDTDRRKILDAIYALEFPAGPNSKVWGEPRSATRRLHIVEILSSRCKRNKQNSHRWHKQQIDTFKADLKYFQDRYF